MQGNLVFERRKRKVGIDILKGLCAILVILIHFPFLGIGGKIITIVARCAVPVFFMCSGFFLKKGDENNRAILCKKLKHVGRIIAFSVILYIFYTIYCNGIEYVVSEINILNLLKLFIFNAPQISSMHLWFLFALFYSYILYFAICKLNLQKYKLGIAAMGLTVNLMVREVALSWGIDILPQFVRNAYFFGLPFFILGTQIRDSEKELQTLRTGKCVTIAIIGLVLSVLENKFLGDYTLELSVGTIAFAVCVFVLALRYSGNGLLKLEYLGENCSLYIYVVHFIVGTMVFKIISMDAGGLWIDTILTVAMSVLISIILSLIINKLKSVGKGIR